MLLRLTRCINRKLLLTSNINAPVSQRLQKVIRFVATTSVQPQNAINPKLDAPTINTPQVPAEQQVQNVVESTTNPITEKVLISEIPDIPKIPNVVETITQLYPNGEPTLESLGLGGYSPFGIVQKGFEALHVYCHMPWWAAILAGTMIVRILIFPIALRIQKHAVNMQNNLPKLQKLQLNMSLARRSGDDYQVAICGHELSKFMKEKQLNPFKSFGLSLLQLPIFLSILIGLRRMTEAPVQSLKEGGLWWFADLTTCDPYYVLPILTCATMYISIEYNLILTANMSTMVKYFLRAMPVVLFPFLMKWPGAILCYWLSTNVFSLLQSRLLKVGPVREYFKIPANVKHDIENLPKKPKSFKAGVKEAWTNVKISSKMEDKRRADAVRFNDAGKGPLKKTFKYDPTKKRPPTAAEILTKSK
ncbi:mitochondrial inner membrane protein OXA1L-like [Nomia melanderi]|uniref:mitochondrial inner membrane protein OXA1L-like n=1 Tax=Nomia melanderi TaxID=2448451 RepID=UPI00130441CA|nr:mitochondrial inner membrane protein OXA1L-like [Nomia melanderi]XP_031831457.1 mitochondrial inner membrane protein OXA1L-like [Nomia melanderi]